MNTSWPSIAAGLCCLSLLANSAEAQALASNDQAELARILTGIRSKSTAAKQYMFDAELELTRKHGENQSEVLLKSKLKMAMTPGGRYLFWAGDAAHLEYMLVSDGERVWVYLPDRNQLLSFKTAVSAVAPAFEEVFSENLKGWEVDLFTASLLVMPILSRFAEDAVQIDMNRSVDLPFHGEDRRLPVITSLSKSDAGRQILGELVVDPDTNSVIRLDWRQSSAVNGDPVFVSLHVDFDKLTMDEPVPATYFAFVRPDDAALVDHEPPIPGLFAGSVLGSAAPDFDLELAGQGRLRLQDLKGHPVLLSFWDPACAPCETQLKDLAKIAERYRDKSVSVVAIAAAGAVTPEAARGNALLRWAPDVAGKIQRAYHVRFLPTTVLIDAAGRISRYMWGARSFEALEAALAEAGL